ncbi:hypothetical protein C8J56DRAFT_1037349 [Mycena floridula]|nr:hypothetical protein C8J56DRAFT_1037349 [Mycena floridula]
MASPFAYLICNTTEADVVHIVSQVVLSQEGTAFCITPYSTALPWFIVRLQGFLFDNTVAGLDQARDLIRSVMSHSHALCQFITSNHTLVPANVSALDAFNTFINNIDVRLITLAASATSSYTAVNVYVEHTTNNLAAYSQLVSIFTGTQFVSTFDGVSRAIQAPLLCHICRGMDHPTGLCPSSLFLTGWVQLQPRSTLLMRLVMPRLVGILVVVEEAEVLDSEGGDVVSR